MARPRATHPAISPQAPDPGPPTLREEAKAMFRRAVLDAAEQIFATEGVQAARIQDIARLARVSVGTIYNHFDQKEDIVAALLDEREREILEAFAPHDDDPPDFLGRFRARNERLLTLIHRHQAFFRFALYEGMLESDLVPRCSIFADHQAAFEKHFPGLIEALLVQGMEEGVLERQDPVRLKRFMTGALRGVMLAALKNPALDPVEEGRFAFEMVLRAMRPPCSRPRPAKASATRRPGK